MLSFGIQKRETKDEDYDSLEHFLYNTISIKEKKAWKELWKERDRYHNKKDGLLEHIKLLRQILLLILEYNRLYLDYIFFHKIFRNRGIIYSVKSKFLSINDHFVSNLAC